MLFGSLVELHAWLHLYLCFSLLEKQFLSNLDTSSTPGYLSRFFSFSLSQSWYLLDNFSIHRESFCLLDSFSITVRSIEVCSIAARHLSISRDPLACIVFHMSCIFLIILSSIASYFITFMNLYGFLMPPWSSLCFSGEVFFLLFVPFINHDKKGEKLWVFFFFKILHVRGRNTCLCKGELCFILLRGVPTSFFMYISLVTMFTYIVLIFDIYIYIYDDVCFLHLPLHVLFLFSLYTHVSLLICNLLFLSHTKMPWCFV